MKVRLTVKLHNRVWLLFGFRVPKEAILLLFFFLTCSTLFLEGASCRSKTEEALPKVELKIGGKQIRVELADTPSTQMAGLMFRKALAPDAGMLFAFPDSKPRSFWMRNTYIPLSIAYMDEKGVILNILEMTPHSEESNYSRGPAKFALEMNAGWFAGKGVKAGDVIGGLIPPLAKTK